MGPALERFTTYCRRHRSVLFWSAIAGLNLTRGFLNALRPGQSQDFRLMNAWGNAWLVLGQNPYLPIASGANYPPPAIVFLSGLSLIPTRWGTLLWAIVNLLLSVVVGYLAFKRFTKLPARRAAVLPCLMFLSWAALRVGLGNGQFSILILSFGLLAASCADEYPFLGGLLIGLALIKPHFGIAFFLWAVFTKRLRTCFVSVGVTLLGLLLFSLRIGESPAQVVQDYFRVVNSQFGHEGFTAGISELRPLIHLLIPAFGIAEIVHLLLLLGLLFVISLVAFRGGLDLWQRRESIILGLCCTWALLAFFHNSYDLVLLLPLMISLYLGAQSSTLSPGWQRLPLWLLQGAMVLEIPGLWWKMSRHFDLSGYGLINLLVPHFDRLVILGLLIFALNRVRHAIHDNRDSIAIQQQMAKV